MINSDIKRWDFLRSNNWIDFFHLGIFRI